MFILKNFQHKALEIEKIPEITSTKIKEFFPNKIIDTFKTMDSPIQW